ncbi:MAG TPA: hypothetical protein VLE95_00720 [Chlamydiales bacterium]|nr:hypothetical protein [Chlamydiales bacterium]
MTIQAIGANLFLPANFGRNSIQMVGIFSIISVAINVLSNLPTAYAKDASAAAKKACEISCEPLPGGKDDAPERICVKTCQEGAEIIKTKIKEVMKNGQWTTVKVLEKVAIPVVSGYFDCTSVCGTSAIFNEGGNLAAAGLQYVFGDKQEAQARAATAAAKAGCTAMQAIPSVGYGLCMSCCAGIKYLGV